MLKKITLASASPRRKKLLCDAGFSVRVLPSKVKEKDTYGRPSSLAMHNALLKARDISSKINQGLILAADTVIYFRGKIIGKPRSRKEAFQILSRLQGKKHWVYTGVCLIFMPKKQQVCFYDKSAVFFKKMTLDEIRNYHRLVNPMDKAGAYAIQEHNKIILRKYEGSFSNIMGLPVEKLNKQIKKVSS